MYGSGTGGLMQFLCTGQFLLWGSLFLTVFTWFFSHRNYSPRFLNVSRYCFNWFCSSHSSTSSRSLCGKLRFSHSDITSLVNEIVKIKLKIKATDIFIQRIIMIKAQGERPALNLCRHASLSHSGCTTNTTEQSAIYQEQENRELYLFFQLFIVPQFHFRCANRWTMYWNWVHLLTELDTALYAERVSTLAVWLSVCDKQCNTCTVAMSSFILVVVCWQLKMKFWLSSMICWV